jgi:hypothetical protein
MEPSNEIFGAMSASRVLVSILKTVNSVKVHQDVFLEANNLDTELSVSYDPDTMELEFSLKGIDE